MLEALFRAGLQAVLGGGANISSTNPLPVTSEISLDHGTATGGTINTLIDTTKGWQVNIWQNAIVEIYDASTGISYTREIDSNTANTLNFATNPLPAAVLAGDTYWIRRITSTGQIHVDSYTGTGNIAAATTVSTATSSFRLLKVSTHWSVATANPVTISLNANAGAAYDTLLRTVPMGAAQDMIVYFDDGAKFEAGDVITVAWTDDTGGAATWGVQIGWEE